MLVLEIAGDGDPRIWLVWPNGKLVHIATDADKKALTAAGIPLVSVSDATGDKILEAVR